jgi:hypothetical protein
MILFIYICIHLYIILFTLFINYKLYYIRIVSMEVLTSMLQRNMALHYNMPSPVIRSIHWTINKCSAVPDILSIKETGIRHKTTNTHHWYLSSPFSVYIPRIYFQKTIYYILLYIMVIIFLLTFVFWFIK